MPARAATTLPCMISRTPRPRRARCRSARRAASRPGCGRAVGAARRRPRGARRAAGGSRSARPARSRRSPRSAARASADSLGDVSRAVSLCTAITERWWATMSWSSRAMRARSSIAVCSRTLSAIASWVAPSAARISVRRRVDSRHDHRRGDEQERHDAPETRVPAVERRDRVEEKRRASGRHRRRGRAAPRGSRCSRASPPERGERQRRLG